MKYFTIKELTTTNTGLPNVPNDTQKAALETLVKNVLDPARELLKSAISVNSGFRSPEVNKAIGGATNSQHLKGEAADLNCSDKAKLFSLIRNNLPFDQKQLGNILSQNDIITADMEFFEIPSKYIVGLPSKITYNNIYEREAIIDSLSGNVTSITQFGDSGFDRITDFQYDNLGNITKIIYPEAQSGRKNITIKYDKKHIITDTNGLLLAVVVHAANEYDGKKAFDVVETLNRFERMQKIYADGGYRGEELAEKLKKELNYDLKITLRSDKETDFKPIAKTLGGRKKFCLV